MVAFGRWLLSWAMVAGVTLALMGPATPATAQVPPGSSGPSDGVPTATSTTTSTATSSSTATSTADPAGAATTGTRPARPLPSVRIPGLINPGDCIPGAGQRLGPTSTTLLPNPLSTIDRTCQQQDLDRLADLAELSGPPKQTSPWAVAALVLRGVLVVTALVAAIVAAVSRSRRKRAATGGDGAQAASGETATSSGAGATDRHGRSGEDR